MFLGINFAETIMSKVRRPIDPGDFTAIPRIREILKTLPKQIRVCSKHGEEVDIKLGELLPNQGPDVPFAEAYWEGCCDEAIARVIEAVRKKTPELIDRAKQTYKDELAGELEPAHMGEIVAIELTTGDHFVGEDEVAAANKARAAGHQGMLYFLRVGSPYAHRLMTPRQ
jgi:hypothetical protein